MGVDPLPDPPPFRGRESSSHRGQAALGHAARRETDGDHRALVGLAPDVDRAVVQRDELGDEIEAEARAVVLARQLRIPDLEERLAKVLQVLRRDADAGIGDGERDAAVGLGVRRPRSRCGPAA